VGLGARWDPLFFRYLHMYLDYLFCALAIGQNCISMSIGWKSIMVRCRDSDSLCGGVIYTRRALRKGQGRWWYISDLLSRKGFWVIYCSSKQDKGLLSGLLGKNLTCNPMSKCWSTFCSFGRCMFCVVCWPTLGA